MFHDAELADTVILADLRIAKRIGREKPLIIISAVALVDDTHMIRLDNAEVFVGAASRNHMSFVALRKFHGNSKRHQFKLPCLHLNIFCRPEIDPVGLAVNIS